MCDLAQDNPKVRNVKIIPIRDLAPTQMTVGMREVEFKRRRWREKSGQVAARYLGARQVIVALGPGGRHYLIDGHHIALALHCEGIQELLVSVVEDVQDVTVDAFWTMLESRSWAHPFDAYGRRKAYCDMPLSVDGLIDDPFRSLAWAVKRVGGYTKDKSPFSEFRWADFLRHRIPRELVERSFGHALGVAMHLAEGPEAAALPGALKIENTAALNS